jgi:hypothetical protein
MLENWALISGRGRDFLLYHNMQTNSEANHQASYPTGNLGLFSGGKVCRGVMLSTQLHIVPQIKIMLQHQGMSQSGL